MLILCVCVCVFSQILFETEQCSDSLLPYVKYLMSGGSVTSERSEAWIFSSTYSWAFIACRKAKKRAVNAAMKMESMPKSRTFHSCMIYSLGPSVQSSLHSDHIIPAENRGVLMVNTAGAYTSIVCIVVENRNKLISYF